MNATGDDHVSFTASYLSLSPCGKYLLISTDGARIIMMAVEGVPLSHADFAHAPLSSSKHAPHACYLLHPVRCWVGTMTACTPTGTHWRRLAADAQLLWAAHRAVPPALHHVDEGQAVLLRGCRTWAGVCLPRGQHKGATRCNIALRMPLLWSKGFQKETCCCRWQRR